MLEIVIANVHQRFEVLDQLVESLTDAQFSQSLNIPKSKTVAEHVWCLIGARQSYTRALMEGEWAGFKCSLEDENGREEYLQALKSSALEFQQAIDSLSWTEARKKLLANLHEHETMHEGQLIRLLYALGLAMPSTSKWA